MVEQRLGPRFDLGAPPEFVKFAYISYLLLLFGKLCDIRQRALTDCFVILGTLFKLLLTVQAIESDNF
jgi:hypothetical protein